VGSLVFVVHHSDVSAGSHVAVTTRRRRNLARKISGHGMLFSPQIRAEHSPSRSCDSWSGGNLSVSLSPVEGCSLFWLYQSCVTWW
jgi:hypothetical protein